MASIYKSEAGKQAVEAFYRSALERWPVPHRELIVPTRHGDTFIVASGDEHAPPLVLFHGSGANSIVWIRDITEWARGHRVYAIDLIGEPGLSAASRPPLRSDAYAEWLDDVWNHLGLAAASIVGVSFGGWLALEYAVKRPARVGSLSLVSPSGIGSQNVGTLVKAGLLRMLGPWGLRRSLRLVAGRKGVPVEVSDFVMLVFRNFRPRMEKLPIRTDQELAALTMPVQVIVGRNDSLIRSDETRDRVQRHVRQLRLTYLEGEGHILPRQTRTIAQFLSAPAVRELVAG